MLTNDSNRTKSERLSHTLFKQPMDKEYLSGENGLTLIECLVAIVVIAATIGMIAPITVMAVATRVQNQRAEQAALIAQSELDRIRLTVERGGNYTLDDVPSTSGAIRDVPAPENVNAANALTTFDATRPIDIDNDGDNDYAVQTFRTEGDVDASTGQPIAFELGVRVYRADAVEKYTASELSTDQASLLLTSGEGQASIRPLAVLYSTIVKSDNKESLCDYYRYVDPDATAPSSC